MQKIVNGFLNNENDCRHIINRNMNKDLINRKQSSSLLLKAFDTEDHPIFLYNRTTALWYQRQISKLA